MKEKENNPACPSRKTELTEPAIISYLILKGFKPEPIIRDGIVAFLFTDVEKPLEDFYGDTPEAQVSALAYSQTIKALKNRIFAIRGKRQHGKSTY